MWPSLYKLTNVSCFIASSLYIIDIHINSERWRFSELDLNRLKARPPESQMRDSIVVFIYTKRVWYDPGLRDQA